MKTINPDSPCSVSRPTNAFTLIELLTVIAIIGVLAAILIPVIGQVKSRALVAKKSSSYRQYFIANSLFAMENKGYTCPAYDNKGNQWQALLLPYLGNEKNKRATSWSEIFQDPLFEMDLKKPWRTGVGVNMFVGLPDNRLQNKFAKGNENPNSSLYKLDFITDPEYRIFIGDSTDWHIMTKSVDTTRHEDGTKGMFVLFDGSIAFLTAEEAAASITNPIKLRGEL